MCTVPGNTSKQVAVAQTIRTIFAIPKAPLCLIPA
jgi:hypothetical protein